jgi:hypothetical protein
MSQPKHPPGPPITPATTAEQNAETRTQNCLAKAAYCKWVASITPDQHLGERYLQLSTAWQKEAQEERAK